MLEPRLEPRKRRTYDGKVYWLVYDNNRMRFSKRMFFKKYNSKEVCQLAIDRYKKVFGY